MDPDPGGPKTYRSRSATHTVILFKIYLNYTVVNLISIGMVSSTVKYFLFLAWTAGVYITAIYIFKRNKTQLME
jgi:hypothetical protein